ARRGRRAAGDLGADRPRRRLPVTRRPRGAPPPRLAADRCVSMPRIMRRPRLQLLVALAAAGLACLAAPGPAEAGKLTRAALYGAGADTRYLLGGGWWHRLDPADRGIAAGYMRASSRRGWTAVTVPHAWNVGDHSNESMRGTVGWYRTDFRLPRGV